MKTFKQLLEEKLVKVSTGLEKLVDSKGKEIGRIGDNHTYFTTSRKKGDTKVKMKHKTKEKAIEHLKKHVSEDTTDYEAHDYYGSPKKKVLTRKSPSSSGGDEE